MKILCSQSLRLQRNWWRKFGDDLEISWLPRAERYHEKLATPDVSVADLIGDLGSDQGR